ncbi:MAG: type III secretion system export apparatus subunit SctT [Candidatus Competibacteraceae bacterium]|nr:type III secretion system export apparatus subunit SctT [Candidatus Competibacteraceae bacterium]
MNEFEELRHWLLVFTFSLPRILATFTMMPVFSRQVLPGMVRNGVAASLALFIFPVVVVDAPVSDLTLISGLGVLIKEVFIGLLIGFGVAALFWSIEAAGFFIDNQRGSTMASSLNPLTGSQTSPMGILFVQTLNVIFFVGGGLLVVLGALYTSYQLWPVFSFFPRVEWDAVPYFLGILDWIMALAVLMAAPVIIAMFLAEFALGLISRFAPQLNVFFLAMPIKSAVGIFILVLYAGILIGYYNDELKKLATHFTALNGLFR